MASFAEEIEVDIEANLKTVFFALFRLFLSSVLVLSSSSLTVFLLHFELAPSAIF